MSRISQSELIRMAMIRIVAAIIVLMAIFFLPAGTFAYWEAWAYLAIILGPMFFVLVYLFKNDPDLLARRMRTREKEAEQKRIVNFSLVFFLLAFLIPGFDKRFGWSNMPAGVVFVAEMVVLLGYGIVFLVFRENRYASHVIEVEQGQTVISSGPYAIVRHPMYLGVLLMYLLSPLALGSYWAAIPAVLLVPIFVARIWNEESVLTRELKGYSEYKGKTRYRLIPGIW